MDKLSRIIWKYHLELLFNHPERHKEIKENYKREMKEYKKKISPEYRIKREQK